jgi:C4-dicarboxylate transporter DctM subunit
MSPTTVGIVGFALLFILLFSRMSIGLSIGLVGFLGFAYLGGLRSALSVTGMEPFETGCSYAMSVVPFFILMGMLAFTSGLSRDFYYAAHAWLRGVPGSLALATVAGCGGFAAVSGSSMATAATMGTIALPEMEKFRYDRGLAAGCVAAGGTLGILIPPSTILILYGLLCEQDIGALFLAGIVPGLLLTGLFMLTICIRVWMNPQVGGIAGPTMGLKEKLYATKGFTGVLSIFMLVMGGLLAGFFTPTEAGAVGAAGVFLLGLVRRRITKRGFIDALAETARMSGMLFLILIGAAIMNRFLAVTRIPYELAGYVVGLQLTPKLIIALIMFMYLILGCLMDSMAMVVLTVPIIFPVIQGLGFNPIWFGVIIVVAVEMGGITPPVGLIVYTIKGIAKDVPLEVIFKGIIPFLWAMVVEVIILVLFPQIALWLPGLLR